MQSLGLLLVDTEKEVCSYLDYDEVTQQAQAHLIRNRDNLKRTTWYRRFGHLGIQKFQLLAKDSMVNSLNFDFSWIVYWREESNYRSNSGLQNWQSISLTI